MRQRHRFFLAFSLLLATSASVLGLAAAQEPRVLSDSEILGYLPIGAKIAEIPVMFSSDRKVLKRRLGMIRADVDGDQQEEVVVAYYALPHDTVVRGKYHASFDRRARVRVLKWTGTSWREQWDSGGCWGSIFQTCVHNGLARHTPEEQERYTANYFSVRDINGDGQLDIIFTTASFGAEGDRFEAWTWKEPTYERIALGGIVRLEDIHKDGSFEIISDYGHKGLKRDKPVIYKWDPENSLYCEER